MAVKVFDDFLKDLHRRKRIPQTMRLEQEVEILSGMPIKGIVNLVLEPPEFRMHFLDNGEPYTRLNLSGHVEITVASPNVESPPLYSIPFYIGIKVDLTLKYPAGKAPILGMNYGGIETVTDPFTPEFIDQNLSGTDIIKLIEEIEMDVVEPIVQALETIYYFDAAANQKPSHDQYPALLRLMPHHAGHFDAIGLFVDIPGSGLSVSYVDSFVPKSSDLTLWFTDSLVQLMVQKGKSELEEWISGFPGGLEVKKLELALDNNRILVDGKIVSHEYDAEGTIKGPIYFTHQPGNMYMHIDSDLDIDLDLPWWADILVFLTGSTDLVHEKIPNMGQKMAEGMANNMLKKVSAAINLEGISIDGIPVEIYPDRLTLDDNCIKAFVHIYTYPHTETIVRADFSKLRGKFMMYHLESGRRFWAPDLARLVHQGFIITPGYHAVGSEYMRANPDSSEANNLLERFGR
jgi:hypothetical protein